MKYLLFLLLIGCALPDSKKHETYYLVDLSSCINKECVLNLKKGKLKVRIKKEGINDGM
jgi:hypothetical protein